MTTPVIDYGKRAGARSKYLALPSAITSSLAARKAPTLVPAEAMNRSFFADISEFQSYVNGYYPYSIISMRGDTGYRTDSHFRGNWNNCRVSSKIQVVIVYVVFMPGQNGAIVNRLKSVLGSRCPSKVVFMIDMESGSGFAGPGNHSWEANQLASELATYAGSYKRVLAYANHYDFQTCWPNIAPWLKKITASYGTSDPGSWGWQYYGAMNYPTVSGFPRSCSPFGSWVDLNVVSKSLAQIKTDLGLVAAPAPTPKPVPTPAPVIPRKRPEMIVVRIDPSTVPKGAAWPGWVTFDGANVRHIAQVEGNVNNGAALLKALGQAEAENVTYEQYLEWKAGK